MKRLCLLLVFAFSHLCTRAQSSGTPEFESDRPDRTEASTIVPRGYWQLETGFEYERARKEGNWTKAWMYPQGLLRVGLSSRAELRLETSFERENTYYSDLVPHTQTEKGLYQTRVGGKLNVMQAKGATPEVTLMAMAELPWGNKNFTPRHLAPEIRLLFTNKISQKVKLQYNAGYRHQNEDGHMEDDLEYTVSVSDKVTKKFMVFAEFFGAKAVHMHARNQIDGGLMYMLLPNLQLDTIIGTGISADTPELFVGGGVSVRLPR